MSTELEYMKERATLAAVALADAQGEAQRTADAYVQARECTKVGDEVEILRGRRRYVVTDIKAPADGYQLSCGKEPAAYFVGQRILKNGTLGERSELWRLAYPGDFRIVGRYGASDSKS